MNLYPTRRRQSKNEYRTARVGGEAWDLIDSIANGRRAIMFLPGGWAFGTAGFLGIFPGAALLSFILLSLLSSAPASAQGSFIFGSAIVTTALHCALMLRMSLGHIYAQQDFILYLRSVLMISCGVLFYGLMKDSASILLLLPSASALLAAVLLQLSSSTLFSLYADLMRVKRLYLHERKNQLEAATKNQVGLVATPKTGGD